MKSDELWDLAIGRVRCRYCEKRGKYGYCPMVHYDADKGEIYDLAAENGYCDRGSPDQDKVGKLKEKYLNEGERR